jgi:hypothetical protein
MKEQIDSLTSLAIHARDYVKRTGIEPIDKYIVFANDLVAYCTEDYGFFTLTYTPDVKLTTHTMYHDKKERSSITFNSDATAEDLEAIYARAFESVFQFEQNSTEMLEKRRLKEIAELESKLAKLKEL